MTEPVMPRYSRQCITDLMPTLLGQPIGDLDLPVEVGRAQQTLLLVLDGLGWEQLIERKELAPNLSAMEGGPITTVAPSTTATALTSLTTGMTPGEHGLIGYRLVMDGEVLNTLRWNVGRRDVRRTIPPDVVQPFDPFLGQSVRTVTKAEFRHSGFTQAHLRGADMVGYRTMGTMVHEVHRLLAAGDRFVYAYYDGIDKVSHEYGFGSVFDAEVSFTDRLVGEIIEALPAGAQLVLTADHGQVDCRDGLVPLEPAVLDHADALSGEGRFRWVHAKPGAAGSLLAAAEECHGHQAWVWSKEKLVEEGWFGRSVKAEVVNRLGDVALLPFEPIGFEDPDDTGPFELVGRHGSLTSAEMWVPLLTH